MRSRIPVIAIAATLTLTGVPAATAAPLPTSSSSRLVLPAQAYKMADDARVVLPDFLEQSSRYLEAGLRSATEAHLERQGHVKDDTAYRYAREWADQAARGEVVFYGNVGDGNNHLQAGSGNVYRLSKSAARRHTAWLNRNVSVQAFPQGKRYGVATSHDSHYVYVVEYFRN